MTVSRRWIFWSIALTWDSSRGDALLNVDGQLTNQSQGLISATSTLTINSTALDNQDGSSLGSAIARDFSSATGDLNRMKVLAHGPGKSKGSSAAETRW
ncbi:hypothetical protein IFT48_21380 [Pseudomonas fluorescens]|uniref:hypothetical protein n=1 Tax=Pseudomonas fluorescens TaxID=294 RepID=UPI0019046BE9|nr:hypothetical protein [Pseudomonas fluorescens]MBD8092549.1 hypothetical protein [Pseudomonas fluorescens]MBD8718517.1 hypothetical protein [Pseudomonas fluorescens]